MPILFIAVQCVECSTMQVKQQKKSSNKWVCAVCNQRQSLMRIHARGHIARDLRNFVQEFNLLRMRRDCASFPPAPDGYLIASEVGQIESPAREPAFPAKRRSDWSEYLDPEEDNQYADDAEDPDPGALCSWDFTTEQPKKHPNRPSMKRPGKDEKVRPSEKIQRTLEGIVFDKAPRAPAKKLSTKWSEYLDEEDHRVSSSDDPSDLHPSGDCSRVEDEVHPDFV